MPEQRAAALGQYAALCPASPTRRGMTSWSTAAAISTPGTLAPTFRAENSDPVWLRWSRLTGSACQVADETAFANGMVVTPRQLHADSRRNLCSSTYRLRHRARG